MNKDYINLALRTESVDGAKTRIINTPNHLGNVLDLVHKIESIDEYKKYIYYGKKCKNIEDDTKPLPHLDDTDAFISIQKVRLLHAGLGMLTEAAEFLQPVIDSILTGAPLDEVNLKEEIGDTQWYLAIACNALNTDFDTEQIRNIDKLKYRYPEKFTASNAINRDIDGERKVLEQ